MDTVRPGKTLDYRTRTLYTIVYIKYKFNINKSEVLTMLLSSKLFRKSK